MGRTRSAPRIGVPPRGERVGSAWSVGLDVPIPLPGDLRAIDVVLSGACVVAVEVIPRLSDLQATIRAAQLKQRDFGATRLVIVIAGTVANGRAMAESRPALAAAFDLDTRYVLRALKDGVDPGRDAIVFTLPVAYHCVFLLGFGTRSPRV